MAGTTVLIVNPRSSRGRTGRRWGDMEALIRRSLPEFEVRMTEGAGHATEIAREVIRAGAGLVISVGGDGTNNEVINGFFDEQCEPLVTDAGFGFIGSGTGSDFGRTLGYKGGLRASAERFTSASPRKIDLGRLTYTAHDGTTQKHIFLNIASCGISGLVDKKVNASTTSGSLAYTKASLSAILQYHDSPVEVTVDGERSTIPNLTMCIVANGRYFGGGMHVAPNAEIDDGKFDVVNVWGAGSWRFMTKLPRLYAGTHLALNNASEERATRVEARALDDSEVLLDVDGEQPGRLPATWEILPGVVTLVG